MASFPHDGVMWTCKSPLTSCFGLLTDSAVVVSALVVSALRKSGLKMDVPALSYIYAAYGKSGLISNGKE